MTDLTSMLKVNAYDNICHEHIAYYTLELLNNLLIECGMEVFDVSYNDVNGGSVRAYVSHVGSKPIEKSVGEALSAEKQVLKDRNWDEFNRIIKAINTSVTDLIQRLNNQGKKVFGLGASTKGNTFLQCCGLTDKDIPYILEVSKDKFGKYCAGSNIPIISEAKGFALKPDYLLILPWHFTEFFLEKKRSFLEGGGFFIVPMPEPRVYYLSNGEIHYSTLDCSVEKWQPNEGTVR
jgi:hypothetical protein